MVLVVIKGVSYAYVAADDIESSSNNKPALATWFSLTRHSKSRKA